MDRPREDWPAGTLRSPPPEPALLDVTVILLCMYTSMVDAFYSYGLMICSYSQYMKS